MGAVDRTATIITSGIKPAVRHAAEPLAVSALNVAIQLTGLRMPFRKAVVAAARLGVRGVEIDARGELRPDQLDQTGLREVRRLLEEHELRAVAINFRTRRGYDADDQIDRRVAATKAAMRFAAQLGAPVVVNQLGRVPDDVKSPAWKLLTETLADVGNFGHHVGASLAVQSGGQGGADLRRLIDALPEAALVVTLDPANAIINGHSPLEDVVALGPSIAYVHARDAARDLAQGGGLEVPLGRGTADFPALLGALENFGYRGFFCVARQQAQVPVEEFAQAVAYLNQIVQ